MWQTYFREVFTKAASQAVPIGGSTIIGIIFIGIFGAIAGFAFTIFLEWWRGGRTMPAFVNALKSWPPWVGGMIGVVFCWIALVLWQIPRVIYQDHQDLTATNKSLIESRSGLVDPRSRDEEIAGLKKQIDGYKKSQSSEVRTWLFNRNQSSGPKMEYILTTGKMRSPVEITSTCDFPIAKVGAGFLSTTSGSQMVIDPNERISSNTVRATIKSPTWSPPTPLSVVVFLSGNVDRLPSCSISVN